MAFSICCPIMNSNMLLSETRFKKKKKKAFRLLFVRDINEIERVGQISFNHSPQMKVFKCGKYCFL